jgi:hypothetical protein
VVEFDRICIQEKHIEIADRIIPWQTNGERMAQIDVLVESSNKRVVCRRIRKTV